MRIDITDNWDNRAALYDVYLDDELIEASCVVVDEEQGYIFQIIYDKFGKPLIDKSNSKTIAFLRRGKVELKPKFMRELEEDNI